MGSIFKNGDQIQNYIVKEKIGGGGFADIYVVNKLTSNDQYFVAKVIRPPKKSKEIQWNSFNAEINALKVLDHPNIIFFYDHFIFLEYFVLILEYCEGGSLFDQIKKNGPIKDFKLFSLAKQMFSALEYSHSKNISHHDIKPQNILFDRFGRPKLADFGISIKSNQLELISNNQLSITYAAPEQLTKKLFDPMRADIWSLGITLFFASTGNFPFIVKDKDLMIKSILEGYLEFPKELSNQFITFIRKILKVNPILRPTISEILNEIENCLCQCLDQNKECRIKLGGLYFLQNSQSKQIIGNPKLLPITNTRRTYLNITKSIPSSLTFVE